MVWMEDTCIKFEETTNFNQPHLQFVNSSAGCYAYLGMISQWNGQEVNLNVDSGCVDLKESMEIDKRKIEVRFMLSQLGVILHEVGHAIGFYHEHARSDRDEHVLIVYENIQTAATDQFDKSNDNNYSVPYDYTSTMHYGTTFFTKTSGAQTIVTLNPLAQVLIGNQDLLSHRDKLLANRMYSCIECIAVLDNEWHHCDKLLANRMYSCIGFIAVLDGKCKAVLARF
ncbi:unnamed protein product, partial [Meganyctiphanes norvegica]